MQTSRAYDCQQRVHPLDPDQRPYTAVEFGQYANTQGMSRELSKKFALRMWQEADPCPSYMSYCRRQLPGNGPVPKCLMEQAILSKDVIEVRTLIEIDRTMATKLLDGLEPPISPITFAVCMEAWGAFECLFTHGALFGPRAMQALTKQTVPKRYLELCTQACHGYQRMAKRMWEPITSRLPPQQAEEMIGSIRAEAGCCHCLAALAD